jgi:hypothetical protein
VVHFAEAATAVDGGWDIDGTAQWIDGYGSKDKIAFVHRPRYDIEYIRKAIIIAKGLGWEGGKKGHEGRRKKMAWSARPQEK